MSGKIKEVYMCSGDWDTFHRKEFCKEIHRKTNELIIVQFPVSVFFNLIWKFKKKLLPYLFGGYKTIKTQDGIEIFSPFILTHPNLWLKFPLFGVIDSIILALQINNFLKRYPTYYKIRLWVYRPYHIFLINRVKYKYLIYDAYDDNELDYEGNEIEKEILSSKKLIQSSNLTLVVSKYTYDKYLNYSEKILRIRNGYSPSIFRKEESNIPPEFINLSKPIIGYTGGIRNWLDLNILKKLLYSDKFVLVLIGEVNRNFKKEFLEIKNHANLLYLGYMSIDKLPSFMYYFKAGLLPYKINNFTKSVFPLKFFEYAALGLPVISTALPEMGRFKNYIGYSLSLDEFIENCENAVNGEYREKVGPLNDMLANNTWNMVINEVFEKFEISE